MNITTTVKIDSAEASRYWTNAIKNVRLDGKIIQYGLNAMYEDVTAFHKAFLHPYNTRPTIQPKERVDKRADWMRSEIVELEDATNVVDQADAYLDIIYFAVGGLVECGVKPQALWDIVQAANMAKLGPDGKPLFHPDGKTKKPEGWVAPEPLLAAEIGRQLAESLA